MATATMEAPVNMYAPADWQAHQKRVQEIRSDLEKQRPELRRCLDPEYAAQFEVRKPLFEFEVQATISRPDATGRLEHKTEKRKVNAQNEDHAWALFCDKVREWPSPVSCDRKIKRLEKLN